jgi:hypothetical protein
VRPGQPAGDESVIQAQSLGRDARFTQRLRQNPGELAGQPPEPLLVGDLPALAQTALPGSAIAARAALLRRGLSVSHQIRAWVPSGSFILIGAG